MLLSQESQKLFLYRGCQLDTIDKTQLAKWLSTLYQVDISEDTVTLSPTRAKTTIECLLSFNEPKKEIVTITPTYTSWIDKSLNRSTLTCIDGTKNNAFKTLIDYINKHHKHIGTLALCSPNNPIAWKLTPEEEKLLVEVCKDKLFNVIIDESYAGYKNEAHTTLNQFLTIPQNDTSRLILSIKSTAKAEQTPGGPAIIHGAPETIKRVNKLMEGFHTSADPLSMQKTLIATKYIDIKTRSIEWTKRTHELKSLLKKHENNLNYTVFESNSPPFVTIDATQIILNTQLSLDEFIVKLLIEQSILPLSIKNLSWGPLNNPWDPFDKQILRFSVTGMSPKDWNLFMEKIIPALEEIQTIQKK